MPEHQSKAVSHEEVEKRAYELYLQRGAEHGHHEEDWLLAEAQLLEERIRNRAVPASQKGRDAPR